jgi:hypothetical protein
LYHIAIHILENEMAKTQKRNATNPQESSAEYAVEMMPIEKLIPYANNPRRNEHAVAKVAGSIKEFGFRSPITVDKDMVIVCRPHPRAGGERTRHQRSPGACDESQRRAHPRIPAC